MKHILGLPKCPSRLTCCWWTGRAPASPSPSSTWDGNFWVDDNVKSCVNKPTGSWLAAQEWTINQKLGQPTGSWLAVQELTINQSHDRKLTQLLTLTTTQKFPPQIYLWQLTALKNMASWAMVWPGYQKMVGSAIWHRFFCVTERSLFRPSKYI